MPATPFYYGHYKLVAKECQQKSSKNYFSRRHELQKQVKK